MKLLIEIPEKAKQAFDCAENNDMKCSFYDHGGVIGNAIKNGTIIPDNATNGDVIKAIAERNITVTDFDHCMKVFFNKDWWNAPYKGEGEDKE